MDTILAMKIDTNKEDKIMKAQYSEEYYRNNWERFMKKVPGKHYINLEEELEKRMEIYEGLGLPTAMILILRKGEAQKVADAAKALVKEELEVVKGLENGTASLGYTTQIQEIKARGEYRTRFEFNCLQYADFKKKYEVA